MASFWLPLDLEDFLASFGFCWPPVAFSGQGLASSDPSIPSTLLWFPYICLLHCTLLASFGIVSPLLPFLGLTVWLEFCWGFHVKVSNSQWTVLAFSVLLDMYTVLVEGCSPWYICNDCRCFCWSSCTQSEQTLVHSLYCLISLHDTLQPHLHCMTNCEVQQQSYHGMHGCMTVYNWTSPIKQFYSVGHVYVPVAAVFLYILIFSMCTCVC